MYNQALHVSSVHPCTLAKPQDLSLLSGLNKETENPGILMDGLPNRMLLTVSAGNGKLDSDILGFPGSSRIQISFQIPNSSTCSYIQPSKSLRTTHSSYFVFLLLFEDNTVCKSSKQPGSGEKGSFAWMHTLSWLLLGTENLSTHHLIHSWLHFLHEPCIGYFSSCQSKMCNQSNLRKGFFVCLF